MARPACSGVRPATSCSRWVNTSSTPTSATDATTAAITPPEKYRLRNRRKSINGDALRRWRRTNSAMAATDSVPVTTAMVAEGAYLANSLIVSTRQTSAASACTEPMKSHGLSLVARRPGSSHRPSTIATATTGTLTRKTEPHQKYSSSTPPTTGPSAAPPEATDAHTPMATARSRSSVKVSRMMASVAGIIIEAPRPRTARAAMSAAGFGA